MSWWANLRKAARKGNVVASIFLLKARHGYREGDAPDARTLVQINLPDAASPSAYLSAIGVTTVDPSDPEPTP